jgi:MFS family permease
MRSFYGWRVVGAAFVLAALGWGIGFYGPPIFLRAVCERTGWSVTLVSSAVTAHFLTGSVVGARLPALHHRFGIPTTTKTAVLSIAVGILGWALASSIWQLFVAALLSGAGWSAMSAAAVNAIVSPWFVRTRPAALAMAYNGGSIGGVVFSPLWVAAIDLLGFPFAAAMIGLAAVATIWAMAGSILSHTPQQLGATADGDAPAPAEACSSSHETPGPRPGSGTRVARGARAKTQELPRSHLWRDRKFLTLAAGMALGLFAQIGLTAHLFSMLAPVVGAQQAGMLMALATALAIAGRTATGWLMPVDADRRLLACLSYALQAAGSVALALAAGTTVPFLVLGIVLFGLGFGNATSLPPLIAQNEFSKDDVTRIVALIVAIAQAAYAFAPAAFGMLRAVSSEGTGIAANAFFVAAALLQGLAIAAFLAGRRAHIGSGRGESFRRTVRY